MVFEGKVLNPSIVSPTTLNDIRNALNKVVSPEGTGKLAMSDKIAIAGKTGAFVNTSGILGAKAASFCGYFPAIKPQFACLIKIYNPQNGSYYGSTVAAPLFKQIAEGIIP